MTETTYKGYVDAPGVSGGHDCFAVRVGKPYKGVTVQVSYHFDVYPGAGPYAAVVP